MMSRYAKLIVASGIVLASGLVFVWQVQRIKPVQPVSKPSVTITQTTDQPSESATAAKQYTWSGPASYPKKLYIPALNVNAFIQNMGVDQHQQVAAPTNILLAGWFVNSARPGERGLSIIDGHINGRTSNNGVFKKLNQLKPGNTVTLIRGDDQLLQYQVMSNQTVKLADVPAVLYSQNPNVVSQLNLITCGGTFDRSSRHYDSRTIVTASLKPSNKK